MSPCLVAVWVKVHCPIHFYGSSIVEGPGPCGLGLGPTRVWCLVVGPLGVVKVGGHPRVLNLVQKLSQAENQAQGGAGVR